MTDRPAPDDSLVLAYVEGTLEAPLRAELEARLERDPVLRAEVEGMVAVKALLGEDAAWGQTSKLDIPPPHLLDAILRAEVAARPDEIRQAVALAKSGPEIEKRTFWARLQSLVLPGGLVLGAAAAVLIVVTQNEKELAPVSAAPTASTATTPREEAPPPKLEQARQSLEPTPIEPPALNDGYADNGAFDMEKADKQGEKAERKDAKANEKKPAKEQELDEKPKPADPPAAVAPPAPPPPPPPAPEPMADALSAAPAAPAPPPPPLTTSVGSGPRSADDSARAIREQVLAKKKARVEAEREGMKNRAPAKPSPNSPKAPPPRAGDAKAERDLTPTEARDELERQKRIDGAALTLTTAERELLGGRAKNALDLARSAESQGAGSLGLVPAALQTRAHLALKQNADAARQASRLLQGDAGDPAIVDGLIAGADAAEAVGDRRLAERLLLKALAPQNKDAARRATAQQKLDILRARDIRDRDAYEAPAAASKAAAPPADANADVSAEEGN